MNPFAILLALFILIPVVEIYLLIQVGGIIGAFPTIILVVFTAVMGAWLLRIQGFSTIERVKKTLAAGGIPAFELLEGLILLIAGVFLLPPGFFTDTIGFLCLMPALRRLFLVWVSGRFMMAGSGQAANEQNFARGNSSDPRTSPFTSSRKRVPPGASANRPEDKSNNVIEGEFRREDDDDAR